jgi:hypothetical protein
LRESHSADAMDLVSQFASNALTNTKQRQEIFNAPGALLHEPIVHLRAVDAGYYDPKEDAFVCLQGDVIETSAAYFEGDQVIGGKYVIASSTCDLVPARREYAILFRVYPVFDSDPHWKSIVGGALKFRSPKQMYLPPTPEDLRINPGIICNIINLDGAATIRNENLGLAFRHASMSLVAWRMFACQARAIVARAGRSEVVMRAAYEVDPVAA